MTLDQLDPRVCRVVAHQFLEYTSPDSVGRDVDGMAAFEIRHADRVEIGRPATVEVEIHIDGEPLGRLDGQNLFPVICVSQILSQEVAHAHTSHQAIFYEQLIKDSRRESVGARRMYR